MSGERILFAGESLLAHALRETAVIYFAGILKVLVLKKDLGIKDDNFKKGLGC